MQEAICTYEAGCFSRLSRAVGSIRAPNEIEGSQVVSQRVGIKTEERGEAGVSDRREGEREIDEFGRGSLVHLSDL